MENFVTDTMALVIWLEKRKMPTRSKEIFAKAEKHELLIYVPGMVLVEIGYLAEKQRIEISLEDAIAYVKKHENMIYHAVEISIIQKTYDITDIPELHDRMIAASGLLLNYPVITNDPKIIASKFVTTIWD